MEKRGIWRILIPMRIFALETDPTKIRKQYTTQVEGEHEVLVTRYHGLSFFFATLREILITIFCLAVGIVAWSFEWPIWPVIGALVAVWFIFVFFTVIKAFLDWRFDMIIVTTDKVILVDQTSIFKQEVKPMHLENIGGISSATQFWNIFPFGQLKIHLKEGLGGDTVILRYVPDVQQVSATISHVVTKYQRQQFTEPTSADFDGSP